MYVCNQSVTTRKTQRLKGVVPSQLASIEMRLLYCVPLWNIFYTYMHEPSHSYSQKLSSHRRFCPPYLNATKGVYLPTITFPSFSSLFLTHPTFSSPPPPFSPPLLLLPSTFPLPPFLPPLYPNIHSTSSLPILSSTNHPPPYPPSTTTPLLT